MRVLAYLARSLARPWEWLEGWPGVTVWMCPPRTMDAVGARELEGYDVLVFKLHGLPGQGFWYGDGLVTALSAETVRAADLSGVVAFVGNCFGLRESITDGEIQDGEASLLAQGVMVEALLEAGCVAVVAGAGKNYAGKGKRAVGADLLGKWFLWGLRAGFGPERALGVAKRRVWVGKGRKGMAGKAARDALGFRMVEHNIKNIANRGGSR